MTITAKIRGVEEVNQLLNDLPRVAFEQTKKVLGASANRVHAEVSAYKGGLVNRTGRLKRSLRAEVHGTNLRDVGSSVFTDIIYAPLQEEGGTIEAKSKYVKVPGGPYLNIPLSANKTAKGVTRMNAREVFQSGGYMFKSKKGNWIVASSGGIPMFFLTKSVTVPPRLGMQQAAEDEVPTLLSTLNNTLLDGL